MSGDGKSEKNKGKMWYIVDIWLGGSNIIFWYHIISCSWNKWALNSKNHKDKEGFE